MKMIKTYEMAAVESAAVMWGTLDFYSPDENGIKSIVQITLNHEQIKGLHRQLGDRIAREEKHAAEKAKEYIENQEV